MTDWHTDRLASSVAVAAAGRPQASVLVNTLSRLVVDPERFPDTSPSRPIGLPRIPHLRGPTCRSAISEPDTRVNSLMVEIRRDMYLVADHRVIDAGFDRLTTALEQLVAPSLTMSIN
jgi:predicted N-formylglutamate amidohydrolase